MLDWRADNSRVQVYADALAVYSLEGLALRIKVFLYATAFARRGEEIQIAITQLQIFRSKYIYKYCFFFFFLIASVTHTYGIKAHSVLAHAYYSRIDSLRKLDHLLLLHFSR